MALPSRRYSRFVFLGKHALVGLVGLMVAVMIVVAWLNERGNGRLVLEAPQGVAIIAKPTMMSPRYQGLDSRNRPFTVTAEHATDEGNKVFNLTKVTADLAPNTSSWISLTSKAAIYYSLEERIELSGGVELTGDSGYIFTTPSATVQVKESIAKGNEPVEGTGPSGTLRANRFEILDGGDRILFYGDIHVTLYRKNTP